VSTRRWKGIPHPDDEDGQERTQGEVLVSERVAPVWHRLGVVVTWCVTGFRIRAGRLLPGPALSRKTSLRWRASRRRLATCTIHAEVPAGGFLIPGFG
jgi:hypothetical protein